MVRKKVFDPPLRGSAIIEAVKEAGVEFVAALPDIVTCNSVLWPMTGDAELRIIPVCKEDEGVSICAGLSYCNRRSVLLIRSYRRVFITRRSCGHDGFGRCTKASCGGQLVSAQHQRRMILIVMTTRTRTAMFWWLEVDHPV